MSADPLSYTTNRSRVKPGKLIACFIWGLGLKTLDRHRYLSSNYPPPKTIEGMTIIFLYKLLV